MTFEEKLEKAMAEGGRIHKLLGRFADIQAEHRDLSLERATLFMEALATKAEADPLAFVARGVSVTFQEMVPDYPKAPDYWTTNENGRGLVSPEWGSWRDSLFQDAGGIRAALETLTGETLSLKKSM